MAPELDPIGVAGPPQEEPPEPVIVPIVGYRWRRDEHGVVLRDKKTGDPLGDEVTEKFAFAGVTDTGVLMHALRVTSGLEEAGTEDERRAKLGRQAFARLIAWCVEADRERFQDYLAECVSSETIADVLRTLNQYYLGMDPTQRQRASRSTRRARGETSRAAASAKGSLSSRSRPVTASPSSSRSPSTTSRPSRASTASKRASASRTGSTSPPARPRRKK